MSVRDRFAVGSESLGPTRSLSGRKSVTRAAVPVFRAGERRARPSILAAWIVLGVSVLFAAPGSPSWAEATAESLSPSRSIDAPMVRAHIERLASDAFLGRGTGEAGTRLAEAYVAERFGSYGLEPVPGEDDFFLDFPLYTSRPDTARTTLSWQVAPASIPAGAEDRTGTPGGTNGESGRGSDNESGAGIVGRDFRPFPFSDSGEATGELVFAGYGISAPEVGARGYEDYAGIDVRGRFVLVLRHEPGESDAASPFDGVENSSHALFATKAEAARTRGALGMILVTDPLHHDEADDLRLQGRLFLDPEAAEETLSAEREAPGSSIPGDRGRGDPTGSGPAPPGSGAREPEPASPPFLAVQASLEVAEALLAPSGRTLRELQEMIDRSLEPRSFLIPDVQLSLSVRLEPELTRIEARNVAGLLPGRDPELSHEMVVIGAHHDHLGAFVGSGDTVFNGADDNASGVAGVLALAEMFASRPEPPRRSILFTTFAAEEIGLLGSRAMVEREQVPMDGVVFLLNMDMLGRNPDRPVQLTGDGYVPGLAGLIDAAYLEQTLEEQTESQRRGRSYRPLEIRLGGMDYMGNTDHAPFFARGVPFLTFFTGLHEDYHQLGDHADRIDFPRVASIVRLAGRIAGEVAERPDALPFLHDISWLGLRVEALRGSARPAAVSWIDDGSQAQRAGIRSGDLVVSIADEELGPSAEAGPRLAEIAPGSSTRVGLRRGEDLFSVTVTRARPGYLGIFPEAIDNETRRELALKSNEGVRIRDVVAGGPADIAGFRGGDILVEIEGRTVDDGSLRRRLAQIGAGEEIEIVIVREGERRTLRMTLSERPGEG